MYLSRSVRRELDGFKVQEISGQLVSGKCLRGRPLVEIGFAGEGDCLDALLLVVKLCIRQVAKFCQAMRSMCARVRCYKDQVAT